MLLPHTTTPPNGGELAAHLGGAASLTIGGKASPAAPEIQPLPFDVDALVKSIQEKIDRALGTRDRAAVNRRVMAAIQADTTEHLRGFAQVIEAE